MCIICDPKNKYTSCICGESWKEFNSIFERISSINSELLSTKLKISTITLCCSFNSEVDLDNFYTFYNLSIKYTPKTKNTAKKEKTSSFYNSLLMNIGVKYQRKISVSVKFFPNGKIQVAGLQTIEACAYCVRKIYKRLLNTGSFKDTPKITDNRIVMVNSDFKINKNIFQDKLCEILSNYHISNNGNILQIIFQPSKYPAINTKLLPNSRTLDYKKHYETYGLRKKFEGIISLLIFRSGSIIITGGKELINYLEIYSLILSILEDNKNILYSNS